MIIGNTEKKEIINIIENYTNKNNKQIDFVKDISKQKEFLDFGSITNIEKTRAVIKVQDGCDNFCSYCIIPYAKGRVRSRKIESVIEEVSEISKKGIKEIVITGIHIASYGKDFVEEISLINLLEEINKIDGIERIRLGSLEPNIITIEFIDRLKKLGKICNHFHLSLQSGCNDTLKRMNRKYTIEQFENSINLLRNTFKDVALTTDIIVGFPGETDDEFEKTYKFLNKINFSKMHIFKYSQRQGTVAAKMENQISEKIKQERSKKLIELSDNKEKEFLNSNINKTVEVLFEQQEKDLYKGHTTNYIVVKVKGNNLENEIKKVKIDKMENLELIGKIL